MIPLRFEKDASETLQESLYRQLRNLILSKTLLPETRLPSSRSLASHYRIARNTVTAVYEDLRVEGYIETVRGIGTQVVADLPESCMRAEDPKQSAAVSARRSANAVSTVAIPDIAVPEFGTPTDGLALLPGLAVPELFPTRQIQRLGRKVLADCSEVLGRYQDPVGLDGLRAALASHLALNRGMKVTPDQIIITNGTQEALHLIASVLVSESAEVVVEDPCYKNAASIMAFSKARLVPVPVDRNGLKTHMLPERSIRLIYVTPSHQFPTGTTLNLDRRAELLSWARRHGCMVVEDDYDSDFRYNSPPIVSLAGLDTSDQVIYVGTMSKSLGPGFRIGYIVAPRHVVKPLAKARALLSLGGNFLEQSIVSEFISGGHYQRHLRRIREHYRLTRDTLLSGLTECRQSLDFIGTDAGMHFMSVLKPGGAKADHLEKRARQSGLLLPTLRTVGALEFQSGEFSNSLVFGFSALTPETARVAARDITTLVRTLS